MREFESGAVRDSDEGKLNYARALSPLVLDAYVDYLGRHRVQADGELRDWDNWKAGFPSGVCLESAFRHLVDWWREEEGYESRDGKKDALCAIIFNASAELHRMLREER